MIDLHILRTDPDRVRESQTRRGEDPNLVDAAVAADSAHRAALTDFERLRAEQKDLGRQVAAADADTRPALLVRTKELSGRVKQAEAHVREAEEAFHRAVEPLSNLVDESAPVGGEEDFTVIDKRGTPRDFEKEGLPPRPS